MVDAIFFPQEKIFAECKPLLEKLHSLQPTGNMETIRLLFSDMAKKPLPVKVLISLIGIESDFGIEGHGRGEPDEHATNSFPTLTREQLLRLFMAGVQEKDSVEELCSIINSHIKKLEDSGAKPVEPPASGDGAAPGGSQV